MENKNNKLTDQQLKNVAGGVFESLDIYVHTTNNSKYTSGETPKYMVGQELRIEVDTAHTRIPCEVLSVSETKTGGWVYKEFVYSVKILPFSLSNKANLETLIGKTYDDVYESCLFENR